MRTNKVLLLVASIAIASYILGASTSYLFIDSMTNKMINPFTDIELYSMEAMEDWALASIMYKDKNEKALEVVNARIDANVLLIARAFPNVEKELFRKNALKTLDRIIKLREIHQYNNSDSDVQKQLEEIYKEYKPRIEELSNKSL